MSSGGSGGRGPSTQFALGGGQAEPGELNTDDTRTGLLNLRTAKVVAQLLIVGGPGAGQRLALTEGRNTVGRAEGNDLVLNFGDPAVSRDAHALITWDPQVGELRLYDGGKTNPIYLNGEPLQGNRPIKLGDIIAVGNTTLRLDRP